MEVVIPDVEVFQSCFGDLNALRITSPVNIAGDAQTGFCLGWSNQLDDYLMTEQRPAAPVDADKREHTMLDAVPLAGAGRVMSDRDGKTGFVCQFLQLNFPSLLDSFLSIRLFRYKPLAEPELFKRDSIHSGTPIYCALAQHFGRRFYRHTRCII
jgi:hypothetical protein